MPVVEGDDAFFAGIGEAQQKRNRSKTEVGSRSELFGAIEAGARPRAALDDSAVDAVGSAQSEKFNRKRDRYDFKVDQSQPKPERQYADGVPLLMDLSKSSFYHLSFVL